MTCNTRFCILSCFVLVLSYYWDRVVSIYSHTVFVRRITVQVGTISVTSLLSWLFYDCYHQPITTVSSWRNTFNLVSLFKLLWGTYSFTYVSYLFGLTLTPSRKHHRSTNKLRFHCFVQGIWLAGFENIGIYCFSSASWLVFIVWVASVSVNAL